MRSGGLFFIFVYLSGRLFFYEINRIMQKGEIKKKSLVMRLIWGVPLLIGYEYIGLCLIAFVMYAGLIALDTLLIPVDSSAIGRYYLLHILPGLIVVPGILELMLTWPLLTHNPLQQIFVNYISPVKIYDKYLTVLCGYMLCLKEGTIFIRIVLNRISAVPRSRESSQYDLKEYERGKLIGILERTFIYFLIIFNQIGAIAVIIALKSLARFNELNDKNFAEYFLIGSLLSITAAAVPAAIIRLVTVGW
jgi:hypothetical protein